MKFLSGVLLLCGVFCGGGVGVLGLGCSDYNAGATAALSGFTGLTSANLQAGASLAPQLPQSLSCLDPGSVVGEATRVLLQYQNLYGTAYQSSSATWQGVGWPANVTVPTSAQYTAFVGLLASFTTPAATGTGTSGIGIPACAGMTVQQCTTLCTTTPTACVQVTVPTGTCTSVTCPPVCVTPTPKSYSDCASLCLQPANQQSCAAFNTTIAGGQPGGPAGGQGLPTLPPFVPPNPADILNRFQQGQPPLGLCNTVCPNNLLCLGSTCVAPQPVCNPPCGPSGFCQLNMSALISFNAQAAAGAFAAQQGGQASITVQGGAQVQAGGRISGYCVGLAPVCTDASCQAQGQVCSPYVGCVPCPGFIPGLDLTAVLAGGFDPTQITGNQTLAPPAQPNTPQTIPPGILAQIQAGSSQFGSLVFGASASVNGTGTAAGATAGSAVTALVSGAQAATQQLLANIRDAALQLAANAQLLANTIQVAANATLEVVLAGQGARCGANTSVAINGPLVIRGNATQVDPNNFMPQGIFNFPPNSQGNQIGAGAVVNAAGGVGLTGDLGNLTLSINAIASAAAAIAVPPGQFLRSTGQVLGSAARVIVQGALQLQNAAFQPALTVTSSGNVTINVGQNGNFTCGPVAIQAGAKVDLWSNGSSTFFTNFTQCDASAVIRVRVVSIASLRANGGSGYVFGYGTINATVKASLRCGAVLYDSTGDSITLINPNQATGRRLLQSSGGNTIAFGDNSAQYTTASNSSSSSTSSSSPSSSPSSSSTGSSGNKNSNSAQALHPTAAGFGFVMLIAAAIHAQMA